MFEDYIVRKSGTIFLTNIAYANLYKTFKTFNLKKYIA